MIFRILFLHSIIFLIIKTNFDTISGILKALKKILKNFKIVCQSGLIMLSSENQTVPAIDSEKKIQKFHFDPENHWI